MDFSSLFTAGIYEIRCLKNNKVYIGESANLLSRLGQHSDTLKNNRHDCFDLQQDFNKYSKTDFVFKVLEF
jgi:group I intron endonuclease